MTGRKTCPKCAADMVQGFIVDAGDYGSAHVSRWHAGEPRRSFWTGVKVARADTMPVATWRCRKCGFLESYALPGRAT